MNAFTRREIWDTSLPDWEARIVEGRSLIPDLPLNDAVADRALEIFKKLRVPDLIGMPTYGEVCDQWVFDLVRAVFGAYDPETKRRALREIFVLIPKKNGKSSIAAAIIVVACLMNERPEAELLLIAPTIQIAKIAFKQAWGIIRADQTLEKLFHVREHLRTITYRPTRAEIAIKAADSDVITGGKAAYTLIDETHEFARKTRADGVFLELRGALASRPDGFLMQITTQSKTAPSGVFRAELEQARAVRDGKMKLPLLPVLYELPKTMQKDWQNPKTWAMVNPNLGRSVDPNFLHDELVKAREKGPHDLALLASQHFNVEIGVGLGGRWMAAEFWGPAKRAGITLETIIAECDCAVVGGDGGGLDDLLGLGVIGRHRETRRWMAWAHAWAHPEVLERRKEIAPRLRDFARDGDLTILAEDDPTGDVIGVADVVEKLLRAGVLPESGAIGLDPYGVSSIIDELIGRGVTDEQLVAIGQGSRLSPAIWGIERKLKDGTFVHSGQPMMDWVMGNAKIDPLIAILNAYQLMSRNPVAAGARRYEYAGM